MAAVEVAAAEEEDVAAVEDAGGNQREEELHNEIEHYDYFVENIDHRLRGR